jgi:hypothetical protein
LSKSSVSMQIVVRILNTGVFAHKPSTLADGGWLLQGISFSHNSINLP